VANGNTQRIRHNRKRAQGVVLRYSLFTARQVDATAPVPGSYLYKTT
jgi:hypothetical protein